jgi:ferritin-like protein
MTVPTHDLDWLRNSLQIAIQLELSTLPPYLTARWTIRDLNEPVAKSINEIRGEEMLHFGLACNLLVAIGGTPLVADEAVVPTYPGPLPGGVRPGLEVALRRLSREQAAVFMGIEYPQGGPLAMAANVTAPTFDSIGEFYEAMLAAFKDVKPMLSVDRQLAGPLNLFKIDSMAKVDEAIRLINLQGEGSNASPGEAFGDLAHFYRFGEIYHGKRYVEADRSYTGEALPFPEVYNMADIPAGGYLQADVPDIATWELITRFDQQYSTLLQLLQQAWTHGNQTFLGQAIGQMIAMHATGRELVTKPRPDGQGNYGPCFRYASQGVIK